MVLFNMWRVKSLQYEIFNSFAPSLRNEVEPWHLRVECGAVTQKSSIIRALPQSSERPPGLRNQE